MVGFIIGVLVGTVIGVTLMALMNIASDADKHLEDDFHNSET